MDRWVDGFLNVALLRGDQTAQTGTSLGILVSSWAMGFCLEFRPGSQD